MPKVKPTTISRSDGVALSSNLFSSNDTYNRPTKTTDASGALVSVSDPGGTVTYTLRPDGQPSSITAPGGVVTSFGYDACGRRTSIADPSAGTQTFSDSYSTTGELTRTVTDANNKTVTTISDKYGKVTNVNRPEFTTTYAYNTDGLLVNETSTNGTSAVFTYDSYDRPATARENAPDGKFLLKTSAYAAGNVSSVQYTSQNGSIGTENFVCANGHNTEIKLNNTASIWKLTEENALGQPTRATTGTMARTYGYTAYGMPTGRTAGSIQNFTYDFDVTGGNLTSAAGQAIVYSAPEVYVKEAGNWKIYYICRDYLGSVTHVANADGSLK